VHLLEHPRAEKAKAERKVTNLLALMTPEKDFTRTGLETATQEREVLAKTLAKEKAPERATIMVPAEATAPVKVAKAVKVPRVKNPA